MIDKNCPNLDKNDTFHYHLIKMMGIHFVAYGSYMGFLFSIVKVGPIFED